MQGDIGRKRQTSYAAVVELADARDLKSLGRDTIPVRARSAAPQRWENESVLSSLFFCPRCLFDSVYSIDEFSRPVNRAGKIFYLNNIKRLPDRKAAFCVKLIPAARSGEPPERACYMKFARGGARGGEPPKRTYRMKFARGGAKGEERPAACGAKGEERPAARGGRTYSLTAPADIPLTIYFTRQK